MLLLLPLLTDAMPDSSCSPDPASSPGPASYADSTSSPGPASFTDSASSSVKALKPFFLRTFSTFESYVQL